ncbi:SPASM domain-containing protein [Paraclostridium sp. AKS46]|nr:SPASM domain-containing protein [Paraclostridium sp. AKS46]
MINNTNIDFIVDKFDKVDISLDGVDEETCSQIRGKGVFEKVLKVVRELQSKNFYDISLSMVFGEKNYKISEEFKRLNEELNTRSIERYFVPSGRGLINREMYSDEDSVLPLVIPKYRENEMDNREKKMSSISSCSCNACIEQIFIDYKGNIYPCPSLTENEYLIGSAFDKKVISILKENELKENQGFKNLNKLYPFNFEKCKDCDVNIFCLKCPARVNTIKNNDEDLNRWCSLTKKNMELLVWGGEV